MTGLREVVHDLRCWPSFFADVWSGEKTFEVRWDDRGFQRGHQVVLREWDRRGCTCADLAHMLGECGGYTGRIVTATIGYVLAHVPGPSGGFQGRGYVVFSLVEPVCATEPSSDQHPGRDADAMIGRTVGEVLATAPAASVPRGIARVAGAPR